MNKAVRIKMLKAMEFLARSVNDEGVFEYWLINGIADGDIRYGDLTEDHAEDLEFYTEDETFADLMNTFLRLMVKANRSGGLLCDSVVSMEAA